MDDKNNATAENDDDDNDDDFQLSMLLEVRLLNFQRQECVTTGWIDTMTVSGMVTALFPGFWSLSGQAEKS